MRRWSNQCAVDSCSATNRVSGGSPGSGNVPTRRRAPTPRRGPAPPGRAGAASGRPTAAQMPASSSTTGRGSPLVTTYASPRRARVGVQRRDERVDGVVDVGGVDERGAVAEHRQPARPRAVDDRARRAGCPPAPTPRAAGRRSRAAVGVVGREREQLGRGLGPRVAAARVLGVGRSGTGTGERAAEVRDGRRRDVHEPPDAGRPGRVEQQPGAADVDVLELARAAR